jgi:hypothetical protein
MIRFERSRGNRDCQLGVLGVKESLRLIDLLKNQDCNNHPTQPTYQVKPRAQSSSHAEVTMDRSGITSILILIKNQSALAGPALISSSVIVINDG